MTLQFLTWTISLALHAGFALFFLVSAGSAALESGSGDDLMVVEQGLAIEGFSHLGQDEMTVEEIEAVPAVASEAQPEIKEVPEVEEHTVLTSSEGPQQDDFPEPQPDVVEQPRPPQLAALAQEAEIAVKEQRAAGAELKGGDTTAHSAYMGMLRSHLERNKVNPRTRFTGTAVIRFTVDAGGNVVSREVTSSSGHRALDEAAMASIDKASPFPPMPEGLGRDQLEISVPFQFKVR